MSQQFLPGRDPEPVANQDMGTITPENSGEPVVMVFGQVNQILAQRQAEREAEDIPELPPLSDEEAHQIIRRLARIEDEKAALKANFDALTKELDQRREHLLVTEEERLRIWTYQQLRGSKRSVRTLHGVAGFRTQPARLVITDDDQALAWASVDFPDAIERRLNTRALPKPEFFAVVDEITGESGYATPEGVDVVPAEDRFYVKSGARATEGGEA